MTNEEINRKLDNILGAEFCARCGSGAWNLDREAKLVSDGFCGVCWKPAARLPREVTSLLEELRSRAA